MSTKLIAFFGNPQLKADYQARVEAHRVADDLIRQTFGSPADSTSGWRGCAVGCTFHDNINPHGEAERQIGVPRILARLEDKLFESMSEERFKAWPGQFLAAIPVGGDLSNVWSQLAVWLLVDEVDGVIRFAKTDSQRQAIQRVADLYSRQLSGEEVTRNDWREASNAAAYAADAAADAAAADAAAAYARRSYYDRMADKLLELLAAAPVAELETA